MGGAGEKRRWRSARCEPRGPESLFFRYGAPANWLINSHLLVVLKLYSLVGHYPYVRESHILIQFPIQ